MTLVALMGVVVVNNAQAQDTVVISGNVMFLSMTNATLTGGFFSKNPALRGLISISYSDFSFSVMRNSDLLDPTSSANVFVLLSSYTKTWGKWSLEMTGEIDVFDKVKDLNLISPYLTIARRGVIDMDVLVGYARTISENVYLLRGSVSKSYQGFTFRAYAWYLDWETDKVSFAGEISKNVSPQLKVSVFGHLNNVNLDGGNLFGVIRVGYSF